MRALTIAAAILVTLALPCAATAADKHVLVLNAYGPGVIFAGTLQEGLSRMASEHGGDRVEVYWEALEAYRFAGESLAATMRDYLRQKYAARHIDAIVAAPDSALNFLLRFRKDLFPGVPIVALSSVPPADDLPADVTTLWLGPIYAKAAEVARQLRPETRRLIVIEGSVTNPGVIEREVRKQLSGIAWLTLEYLRDRPLAEVLARVRTADRATGILFIRQLIGEPNESLDIRETLSSIASAATAPLYTSITTQMGRGPVGGYVTDIDDAGVQLMKTALRIVSGEAVPRTSTLALVPMFDARELARWHISEARLPAGSVIRFREPTFWEQHRLLTIGTLAVLVAQALLIAGLMLHRSRRRRAEAALRDSEAALRASHEQSQQLAGRLISAQEAERKRIARDLHDDLSQKLALLNIGIDQLAREPAESSADITERVRELSDQAGDIAGDVHRLSHELHPSKLEVLGLVSSIRGACADVTNQYGVRVEFRHERITTKIPPDVSLCLYRIVQEALHNVVKHSGAREASVRLAAGRGRLHLHVADRGKGFAAAGHEGAGLGLVSMRERVHHAGGRIAIRSSQAHGTRIAVHVPFESQPAVDGGHGTMSA